VFPLFQVLGFSTGTSRKLNKVDYGVYSVTTKPGRWDFVNIEKIHNKYQLLMVRFIKVIHPPRYGEI